jgi:hypothetical protein
MNGWCISKKEQDKVRLSDRDLGRADHGASSGRALVRVRLNTTTLWPTAAKRSAMALPSKPVPSKAIFSEGGITASFSCAPDLHASVATDVNRLERLPQPQ